MSNFVTPQERLEQAIAKAPQFKDQLGVACHQFIQDNCMVHKQGWSRFRDIKLWKSIQVSMDRILIDKTMTREVDLRTVLKIVTHFSENLVKPISVYEDASQPGKYIVWDGQHTFISLFLIFNEVFARKDERIENAMIPIVVYKDRPNTEIDIQKTTAKFVYEDSWQIAVSNRLQLTHIQGRKHGDFFKTIRLVDDFILDTPHNQTILDVGCGYNLNKIYYPQRQIHGIDITLEADTFGWLEEVDLTQIDFQHAIAINSIHFGSADDVFERIRTIYNALPVGGRFLFTVNNLGKANEFKSLRDYKWHEEFDVEYKYLRTQQHKQQMREQSLQVIEKNARYNDAMQDIAEIQEKLDKFIEYDFFHGLLRVIIKKNR